jgi:hypothetical protein
VTLLLGLVLALLAVFVVVLPILRPAQQAARPSILFDEPEDDPLEHRKALALAALKEIEFDRATGKLSDDDYQVMLARYTREAVEALHATDAPAEAGAVEPALAAAGASGAGGNGHAPATSAVGMPSAEDTVERLIAETRKASRGKKFCTSCGAQMEGSGRFCVECGAPAT